MRNVTKLAIAASLLSVPLFGAVGASAADQPNSNASCNGQVNGYYNSHASDGGQVTSGMAQQGGYGQLVQPGAHAHGDECNVPAGVPIANPKTHGSKAP